MRSGRIIAVLVGMPRTYGTEGAADPLERPWTTALYKEPVAGPVRLGRENLSGDQPAQRSVHGGPEMAVLAYAAAHYPRWRDELGLPDLPYGAFGENLLVDGFDESSVCIGDVFAVGDARIQVSQPRGPCWKLERRWRIPDLIARVRDTGRGGVVLPRAGRGHARSRPAVSPRRASAAAVDDHAGESAAAGSARRAVLRRGARGLPPALREVAAEIPQPPERLRPRPAELTVTGSRVVGLRTPGGTIKRRRTSPAGEVGRSLSVLVVRPHGQAPCRLASALRLTVPPQVTVL